MAKYVYIIIAGLVVIGAGIFIATGSKSSQSNTSATATQQSPVAQAMSQVAAGTAQLFDVRTPQEFASGNVKGSINFDSVKVAQGEPFPASKDATIYLYCRSGNRAGQVKTDLEKQGYTNVTNLGGLSEMQAAGLL
jgi:phage shock protein E